MSNLQCAPKSNGFSRTDCWILFVLILVGVLIRLHFLVSANFPIDSDEAIVGLMARHILEGKGVPTFYYGQHYMGSLEPLSVATGFWLFGDNHVVLRLVPLCWFILLLIVFYRLCLENIGSHPARIATALMAVAPAAFIEWSTKARGGFIEIIVLAALSLLFAFRFYRNSEFKNAYICSFILGVGWWTNNQIIYFFPATALIFISTLAAHSKYKKFLQLFFISLFFFLLGGAPFWIYNINNDWISFGLFNAARQESIWTQVKGVFDLALPMILGGKRFWTPGDIYPSSSLFSLLLYGTVIVFSIVAILSKNISKISKLFIISALLTIVTILIVFSVSRFGSLYTAPRYLLPIYLPLFPLVGVIASLLVQTPIARLAFVAIFTMFNFASAYAVEMAIPGEPIVHNDDRVSRDHSELLDFLQEQKITYVRTNYWIGYRLAFETKEQVRFKLFQTPKEPRIKEYELTAHSYQEYVNLPIIASIGQAPIIRRALRVLKAPYKETIKSGYCIFYDMNFVGLDGLKKIPQSLISATASIKNENISNIFDHDLTTRWGSGKPQDPSMKITVKFTRPVMVKLLELDTGKFGSDSARALEVYGRKQNKNENELLIDKADSRSISFFLDNEAGTGLLLSGEALTEITLAQVGKDSFFDWSIAELEVFE
jgi:4-amino-4-deoxy-L-arabinose transferase-like glycosyltransferase